ncbi:endonuclease/exonuclease/phosphatase family protein [Palleronia caenipelagi]|uniref:Endonuclease/exonuclease/phosphatase family protein n=2 Tax=Palleronia caenipelagi TaxID=2489174 RepID=A0A547Q6V4_9RHOB|nr:endonuclease/exonuclease/phosphatase family protein [Palleronia caenipelagi]
MRGEDARIEAALALILATRADILVLQDIDYDAGQATLGALADRLRSNGLDYPHLFSALPNSGMRTGLDLDGDGQLNGPRDAQGYGRFAGAHGMAVLSRYPFDLGGVTDLSALLWRDLPGGIPPELGYATEVQRLSSVAHWVLPVVVGDTRLTLLTWAATPPVFDGPEDRNGRRANDEAALWMRLLDGVLELPAPEPPYVILGLANVDPLDGEGRRDALNALLSDSRLQDPQPRSTGAAQEADPQHSGDPALDTAAYDMPPGNLRLSYVLPSAGLHVDGSGVVWGVDGLDDLPPHRPVWVDLRLKDAP